MSRQHLLWTLLVAAATTGCATPPAALNQANNTVALMSSLEVPMSEFRKTWAALEESRLQTLKTQRRLMATSDVAAERSHLARTAAGDVNTEALRARLLANADAVQSAKAKVAEDQRTYEQKLDALLQPIPSATASITAAQSATAKMGAELSKETRTKELLAFVQEVKEGIDKAKKAQQAAKDAATATAETISANDKPETDKP
jgi:hypothetical protein